MSQGERKWHGNNASKYKEKSSVQNKSPAPNLRNSRKSFLTVSHCRMVSQEHELKKTRAERPEARVTKRDCRP